MESNKIKEIIIDLLQKHHKDLFNSNITPQYFADAIITKINFQKSYKDIGIDKVRDVLNFINEGLDKMTVEMQSELNKLNEDEKLLANFIRGKLTSYLEVIDLIKQIK